MIYAAHGERDKALVIIEDLNPYRFTYLLSSVYSALGMRDKAIEVIETGREKGFYEIKTYLYSYPYLISNHFFDRLRSDPHFQRIVEQEKKRYEEKIKEYEKARSTK